MKVYIAGRITGAGQAMLRWHERLGRAFRKAGFETFVPHQDEEDDRGAFRRDLKQLASSDVLVASLCEPSTGTGIELALFQGPVLIVHRGEMSPMVEGMAEARNWSVLYTLDPLRVVKKVQCML